VGCHGLCERGPIVVIEPGNILYQRVEEPDVEEIYRETVLGGRVVERLLYEDPRTGLKARTPGEIPFYAVQQRIVLEHNGRIDPTRIEITSPWAAIPRCARPSSPWSPSRSFAKWRFPACAAAAAAASPRGASGGAAGRRLAGPST
jgi:(2Fe-2S) ferredoxin